MQISMPIGRLLAARARDEGVDALGDDELASARVAWAERLRPYHQADGYRIPTIALLAVGDR